MTASLLVFDLVEQKLTEARGRKEERVALRSVRVPTGEPYVYVVVRTDAGANAEARYNLRLPAELPKAGGEVEPNDDPAQRAGDRRRGRGGAATVAGYLGRGDVDVYRYAASEPVELDVEAVPPERVDIKLEVLRPDVDGARARGRGEATRARASAERLRSRGHGARAVVGRQGRRKPGRALSPQ